ncbi:MaoC family dehydratase [Hoyosella altamirensis]|uniref:Acyl dehydratase n=1 Tax=Hoyosella altamirensis TaxID=616997 RepID=A0A839RIJ8_9ACTN|nr:MaoC family dehydratase [Hoyosella altamirensis]MBB3036260.1 acyl dehydratase [Hoyosella altamirensis]
MYLTTPAALKDHIGTSLGTSSWTTVTQDQIDQFAEATGDTQWIHTDPERAKSGPFGTTIAHGYLTLSLIPGVLYEVLEFGELGAALNYGLNRVRFPAPVPVGSVIRSDVSVVAVKTRGEMIEAVLEIIMKRQGHDTPVCVAEAVVLYS